MTKYIELHKYNSKTPHWTPWGPFTVIVILVMVVIGLILYTTRRGSAREVQARKSDYAVVHRQKGFVLHYDETKQQYIVQKNVVGACVFRKSKAIAMIRETPDLVGWQILNLQSRQIEQINPFL